MHWFKLYYNEGIIIREKALLANYGVVTQKAPQKMGIRYSTIISKKIFTKNNLNELGSRLSFQAQIFKQTFKLGQISMCSTAYSFQYLLCLIVFSFDHVQIDIRNHFV